MPLCAPHGGGDGASDDPAEASVHAKAEALATEQTGVRFEQLVLFAEPLFEEYDLDADAAFGLRSDLASADEATVAALEAARVIWAYFSLPDDARRTEFSRLADYLLGTEHESADEHDLDFLLERMEEQWLLMSEEELDFAHSTESETLDFDALLAHPLFAPVPQPAAEWREAYGADALSPLEAQALFAQPLLDAATEIDEIEATIERANLYWELAHLDDAVRRHELERHLDRWAATGKERRHLETEATEMFTRFDELFPRT